MCFYYNDLTCEVILDTTCAQHDDDNDERLDSLSAIYKVNHTLLSCPREGHTIVSAQSGPYTHKPEH